MHEQEKSVLFGKCFVGMTGLFPSAQYLEAEGSMDDGGEPGNINQSCNFLQRIVDTDAEDC